MDMILAQTVAFKWNQTLLTNIILCSVLHSWCESLQWQCVQPEQSRLAAAPAPGCWLNPGAGIPDVLCWPGGAQPPGNLLQWPGALHWRRLSHNPPASSVLHSWPCLFLHRCPCLNHPATRHQLSLSWHRILLWCSDHQLLGKQCSGETEVHCASWYFRLHNCSWHWYSSNQHTGT